MRNLFLDIETYSSHKEFNFDGMKVITVQHKWDYTPECEIYTEWGAGNEKALLQNFAGFLSGELKKDRYLCLIGHNLLRFDIPFLIHRMLANSVDVPENLLDMFHSTFVFDTMQMLLPFNGFFVSGLSGENLDKVLKIQKIKHGNYEIRNFYENEAERHKIEEHARGDLLFIEELWKLIRAGKITTKSGHVVLKL